MEPVAPVPRTGSSRAAMGSKRGGAVADRAEPRILIRRRNWNANHGRLRGWIAVAVAALAIVVVVVLVAWPR
jgi:uncharacterized membrane protein